MGSELDYRRERAAVAEVGRAMLDQGLTTGTGGNVSQRCGEGEAIAVTPSGVPYQDVTPETVAVVTLEGEQTAGSLDASSETPMHTAIYRRRDDVGGVVHTHSPYASTFAALGEPIPPSHYLLAVVGGRVPVAGWEQPGTDALGERAVEALGDAYDACLLQNHGTVAVGSTAAAALEVATTVEFCARVHYQAISVGDPAVLPDEAVERLVETFEEYGQG